MSSFDDHMVKYAANAVRETGISYRVASRRYGVRIMRIHRAVWAVLRPRKTNAERSAEYLRRKLLDSYIPEPNSGCWLWTGRVNEQGYGWIGCAGISLAHRASWVVHRGSMRPEQCVLHKCDVPSCINPDHLWLGTRADNNADRDAKGRSVTVRGERVAGSKLTAEKVRRIRTDARTLMNIASDYGVHFSLIARIKQRKAWPHV